MKKIIVIGLLAAFSSLAGYAASNNHRGSATTHNPSNSHVTGNPAPDGTQDPGHGSMPASSGHHDVDPGCGMPSDPYGHNYPSYGSGSGSGGGSIDPGCGFPDYPGV